MKPSPSSAVIDSLVASAVAAGAGDGSGSKEAAVAWGALWRTVLELPRWFFVKDDSGSMRPGLVTFNGESAVPAFTDMARAIAFADGGRGGTNAVFASPPRDVLQAASSMEDSGVRLFAFDIQDTPFGIKPSMLRTLLDDLARLKARTAQTPAGQDDTQESTIVDELAASARATPGDTAAQSALWQAVFELDHWYFVPRGPSQTPLAVSHEAGPTLVAFTSASRAAAFAARLPEDETVPAEDRAAAPSVVAVPTASVVGYVEALVEAGVAVVHVDPANGAFSVSASSLRALHERVVGSL
ncbi:hypothetical protein [Sanguibacter inulinus]|uniref:SseB protein N-terminal domain-containing protein n=1 Tax=Sanguibacter inulinus TaxID=60922 RepID=A0A853EQA2_9MICO|nr:hypothetical protein [Sanguibacter inulinus]MBF0721571.1 hypothetical protein [Sanguibacter inulinus]NYS92716.1 hypothetical protein [Sanguibacter inulinus]